MTSFEDSRLATTDERGRRVFVQPLEVRGVWQTRRQFVQWILISVYMIIPWLQWNGERLILFDIQRREFYLLGLHLRAHDAPLLFFVLASAGFSLLLVTAIWGRIWCGWACPQTVFVERIFRAVERWVEGPAHQRRQLQRAPLSWHKVRLKSTLWFLYLGLSLILTHVFLSYFVKISDLWLMIRSDPRTHSTSFLFIAFSTAIILVDFAWFREQFCLIVCPYGRFQSVLMDSQSLAVTYDKGRGEPRGKGANAGHCIDCHKCVEVCPTAIDIREGVQMECIACTACIDACDQIMDKMKRPRGLIRYDSVRGLEKKSVQRLRPRTIAYGILAFLSIAALILLLVFQKDLDVQVFRASGEAPYQVLNNPDQGVQIINHFKIELSNQSRTIKRLRFAVSDEFAPLKIEVITANVPVVLSPGQIQHVDVFLRFTPALLQLGQKQIVFKIEDRFNGVSVNRNMTLVGPL